MNRFAVDSRITIADVARRAGVSKTTVSHVLSGNRPVAAATRVRVEEAIEDLGYRPDGLARSLRTKRSDLIALIMPDITNPFYPMVARGLESSMHAGGLRTLVCSSDGRAEQELAFLREVWDRRVDGVVIDSWALSLDEVFAVVGRHVPIVWIGGVSITGSTRCAPTTRVRPTRAPCTCWSGATGGSG